MTGPLANWLLARGRERIKRHDPDGARRYAALLGRLRNSGGYELLASAAFEEDDPAQAVEILRDAADRYPEAWLLDSLLGQAFSDQGAYAAARERFQRVYARAGPSGLALYNLATVAGREGGYEEALELLDRCVAEGEPHSEGRLESSRGYQLLRLGRLEEAETMLRGVSDSGWAAATLALVLAKMGRKTEAWAAVRESFRTEPGFANACEATRVLLGEDAPPASREYRLSLHGLTDPATHPIGKRHGFYTVAWVNDDDEEEAREIAWRVEYGLLALKIDEST